ncbi:serine/threonine-protein kinase-like protein [Phaeosphaeriaceae sp. PMI808]|nr:serine/threonine-protein kinase-like protein [Phaeosphaeriaceae sp. PMI808]
MPPNLRRWIQSLWKILKSTRSLFDIVIPLMRYCYAFLPRSKTGDVLQIESARDLSPLYEAFSAEDDEDGNPKFLYSSFGFINEQYIAYFGTSALRKYDLTSRDIRESLQRLPDDDVYPKAPWGITKFTSPIDTSRLFVKGPKLHTDFIGTGLLPKLILQEAEIFELLLENPHPNIIRYHGCLVERGRIVGIVLDQYPMTLKQRLENGMRDLDVKECMSKITSAVRHLHTLGLAHNDLTPMNIMVDKHDKPVIIDFGSCQPFGCKLITAGTPGWIEQDFAHSAQGHDDYAVGRLQTWLKALEQDSAR